MVSLMTNFQTRNLHECLKKVYDKGQTCFNSKSYERCEQTYLGCFRYGKRNGFCDVYHFKLFV